MRRIFLSVFVTLATLASAHGEAYSGSVLYLMTAPNGLTNPATYIFESGGASAGQVVGRGTFSDGNVHAVLWSVQNNISNSVDLNPANYTFSAAYATCGSQQIGQAGIGDAVRAVIWSGSAASMVDLTPNSGYAEGLGTNGTQEVGDEDVYSTSHALLWNGSSSSQVDLNPTDLANIDRSVADGTDGVNQVGSVWYNGATETSHAVLWSGTANSAVDLNPTKLSGISSSYAYAVAGSQQVGYGSGSTNLQHALLWSGTSDSAIDLNPTGFDQSVAFGTNGEIQVGWGAGTATGGTLEALAWSGSADSAIDLQNSLPISGSWTGGSMASTADDNGNIFGTAIGTYDGDVGEFAVEWSPVPEPTFLSLIAGATICQVLRGRWGRK